MPDIFDQITGASQPAPPSDVFDQTHAALAPKDAFDQVSPPATNEDAMHRAGTEVIRQNAVRRQAGIRDLTTDETGAIMDAYKMLAKQAPDQLRGQIAANVAKNTQVARGIMGDVRAASFEALTNYVPSIATLIDPETGLGLKQGQQAMANVNRDSTAGKVAGFAVGMGMFAAEGVTAPFIAAAEGAGEQRGTIFEARAKGQDISGGAEALETTARGVVDGVLTKLMLKSGGQASKVVSSFILPSVKEALAKEGLDTAGKLARTWAMDTIKSGAISETNYLADVGLGHLADPNVRPTWDEAEKAAAFGMVLPSAMGIIHGAVGKFREGNPVQQGAAPDPDLHPMGREPAIVGGVEVPDTAGTGADPEKVYISKDIPQTLDIDGKPVDIHRTLALHETTERALEDKGMSDDEAHAHATAAEHDSLRRNGVDPQHYEDALAPHEEIAAKNDLAKAPDDLDRTPYKKPPLRLTQERDIEQYPVGSVTAIPHSTYNIARQMSPEMAKDFGSGYTESKGENLWVRPSGDKTNADRHLLVVPSDKLSDPTKTNDFSADPSWAKAAAKQLPNADTYVVRNADEAAKFVADAKYGTMSIDPAMPKDTAASLVAQHAGKLDTQVFDPAKGTDARHFRIPTPALEAAPTTLGKVATALGKEDILTAGKAATDILTSAAGDLHRTFSPGTRGENARQTVASMRQENSRAARKADIRYAALDQARRAFDVFIKEYGQTAADDFMDRINRGEKQRYPELQDIADTLDTERRAKVEEMKSLGVGAGEKFDADWFGRQWQDTDKARGLFLGRRPLTGPKSFLKSRSLESVAEGREMGLKLVTDNPIEMHVMKMGEMDKYIHGVRVLQAGESNGTISRVQSGEVVPSGWSRIHDQIGLYKALNPTTGKVETGSFYAPEEVATLINNHLSPGLRGKDWFKAYLGAGNMLNQFQLGMSGFHLMFTSADAIVSKNALALRELSTGDLSGAITSMLGSPLAPVTNAMLGHKGLMEWYHPGSQGSDIGHLVGILEDAGARVAGDPIYRTHVTDKMMSAFRQGNVLGGLGRALLLPCELPTRFIMETVVPRQKLGVAMDLVRMEMMRNPGISRAELVAKARSAWDSADNRMGQLVYDNLFWNRAVKDIAMATTRSVGWNLGTFREIVGGAYDLAKAPTDILRGKPAELTNRAAYLLALPVTHAMCGSLLNYMFTGQPPQNLTDAFFPRTGGLDENGNPKRVSLPTYCKDIYGWASNPAQTLKNKVHPLLTNIYDMLTNKDFYGDKIRNEDDSFMQQVKQEALYAAKQFEPLSIRNLQRGLATGESPAQAAGSFVGVTPAPLRINQSPAERLASDMAAEGGHGGPRTQEQVVKSQLEHDLEQQVRRGDTEALRTALTNHQITHDTARLIQRRSQQTPLAGQVGRLSPSQGLKIWDTASPQEQAAIKRELILKLRHAKGSTLPDEYKSLIDQFRLRGIIQ
jgi:hypothetical protein